MNNSKKKSHSIAKKFPDTKNSSLGEYLDTISLQMFPATTQFIERLALKLVTWARENPKAYKITQFCELVGVGERQLYDWATKHEIVKEAIDTAKMVIGNRREAGALEKALSESIVRFTMPMYDKAWEEREKAVAALKDAEERAPTVVNVSMPSFSEKLP